MKASFARPPRPPLIAGLVLLLLGLASTARAATCTGLADALAQLSAQYREEVLFQGQTTSGQRLIITAAPDGSTWTELVQPGPDRACPIGSGTGWQIGTDATPAGQEG